MTIKRVAITGSSGYLGSRLTEYFRQQGAAVLGVDVRPPGVAAPDEFFQCDICDPQIIERTQAFAPDTVIHSAFAFQPLRDEARMQAINLGGTQNVLSAVARIGPARFLTVSSATAFGAWPDNPVPIDDAWPLRARTEFRYAADKTAVEQQLVQFAGQYPQIAVSWVRPAIIGGPGLDNYLSRFIFGLPFLVAIDGADTPLQFVHEHDVTAAIGHVLAAGARGGFNLGPPDWTCISEIARETRRWTFRLPYRLVALLHGLAWKARLPFHESPASFLYFARYPWVVAPTRLQSELGYQFQYSCRDTLRAIIHSRIGTT